MNPIHEVDFCYIINLDQRPGKIAHCFSELSSYGIVPYRFSAVNGWELTSEELNDLGVKYEMGMAKDLWGTCYLPEDDFKPHHELMHVVGRNYFCHCMTRGAVGIVLSHLSVLQDALDSGYETIWVMEDDIQVIQDPHLISARIHELDALIGRDGWDILFTDQDTKSRSGAYVSCYSHARRPEFTPANPERFLTRTPVGRDFKKIGARYGAYSMIVRKSGMKKILNFLKEHNIFLPYDMEYGLPNDIKMYSLIGDIVSTLPQAASDNGGPGYLKGAYGL
jgi:GR25 family glycosyltransferase involved in LPS biosynthesis